MRAFLPEPLEPDHSVGGLGPHGQGLEPDQLPSEDQPLRPHRLPQHRDGFARRQSVRQRRQGLQGHAVGSERRQAFAHARPQRHHHGPVLLAEQVGGFFGCFVCCLRSFC